MSLNMQNTAGLFKSLSHPVRVQVVLALGAAVIESVVCFCPVCEVN